MSAETLPREELLRKMLNMTTSDNDGQALVAIRKANALLASAGWDWDKLLAGKIKIVENPFKGVPHPKAEHQVASPPPPPTRSKGQGPVRDLLGRLPFPNVRPRQGCKWEWDNSGDCWVNTPNMPAPGSQRAPHSSGLGLSRKNLYAKHCYCCGDYVPNEGGFIMKPFDFNSLAPNAWHVCCKDCNTNKSAPNVFRTAAPKNTGQTTVTAPAPSLGNL